MFETLKQVGTHFRLPGTIYTYDTITLGNINATYKVTYQNSDKTLKSYLFQKVNTNVFQNPKQIMENIDRVTSYIREKHPNQISLHFYHTDDGHNYYVYNDGQCEEGYFWRISNYIVTPKYSPRLPSRANLRYNSIKPFNWSSLKYRLLQSAPIGADCTIQKYRRKRI